MSRITSFASVLLLGSLVACGPASRNGKNGGGDDNGGTDANTTTGGDAGICATEMVKAEQTQLDIFIMLDQSSSMSDSVAGGGNKWTAVTAAIKAFVQQPALQHVAVGIQYFGLPASSAGTCTTTMCNVDADCGAAACGPCIGGGSGTPTGLCFGALSQAGGDSCTASDYAGASVEIAALPGVSSAIISSLAAHSPTTSTPTSAALQGAIDHSKAWATAHAGETVVVVFATDGDPTECDTSLANIDAIAAAGKAGTPKILTFVIGVGSSLSALNGIAAAGGTTSAFLVDTGGNVNAQFLAAMNAVQHTALGCTYSIPLPTTGSPNYDAVNVNYTPGSGGGPETIPNVPNAGACPASGDAWYYDNPNAPTQIVLCASTCTKVSADTSGEVDVALGCSTIIL